MLGSKQKKAIDSAASEVAALIVFHICFLFFVQLPVYFVYYSCWLAACRGYQGSLGFSSHRPIQCRGAAASQSSSLFFDEEAAWHLTPWRNLALRASSSPATRYFEVWYRYDSVWELLNACVNSAFSCWAAPFVAFPLLCWWTSSRLSWIPQYPIGHPVCILCQFIDSVCSLTWSHCSLLASESVVDEPSSFIRVVSSFFLEHWAHSALLAPLRWRLKGCLW